MIKQAETEADTLPIKKENEGTCSRNVEQNNAKNEKIDLLHKYNEIKDATQILIGAIANLENKTIREVHDDLKLPCE